MESGISVFLFTESEQENKIKLRMLINEILKKEKINLKLKCNEILLFFKFSRIYEMQISLD